MGKLKKEELLTLLEKFEQVNGKIERNQPVDIDMLIQCQSQAIDLGNYIELAYKDIDTSDMIQDLEAYCECLYQLSRLEKGENKGAVKKVRRLLDNLQNAVRRQLPADKKVIVFLPYKASMWDSLESIYLAAKEDENTEAYVIPIPYFDRNNDGSFGQMHYEGEEYPDDVPITDWQEFDLEQNDVDVIYIHNPYDDCNYVTSVHPKFYSENLRKYANELIYVPYFVVGEIDPKDRNAVDRMKHFCFLPGVIHATKVIVESEDVRKIYISEYLKAARESGLEGCHIDRKFLEVKIQGSGSPKYAKVLSTRKEDVSIPEKWLPIIQKPDGTWKKVVLYNTSVKAILENNRKVLEKMKSVFDIFFARKEEIALLWRPHPLMDSTLKAMRPVLWQEYRDIVERYKAEGWGIYDDTADMNRAVALSDAYYGDTSSIVQLYKQVDKPIMITDYEESGNENKTIISGEYSWI